MQKIEILIDIDLSCQDLPTKSVKQSQMQPYQNAGSKHMKLCDARMTSSPALNIYTKVTYRGTYSIHRICSQVGDIQQNDSQEIVAPLQFCLVSSFK